MLIKLIVSPCIIFKYKKPFEFYDRDVYKHGLIQV